MPVTGKLSKAFYDRLGEQIANELVEWFNQVDLTYRNDLRELNELNFQRFIARLDERVGASEAKAEVRVAALGSELEQHMVVLESRLEQRLAALEGKLERRLAVLESKLERRLAALESEMERRLAALEGKVEQRLAGMEATLERRLGEQTRWLFVMWASLLIPIIGLWFRG